MKIGTLPIATKKSIDSFKPHLLDISIFIRYTNYRVYKRIVSL